MQTSRQSRAASLLALTIIVCVIVMRAQQPAVIDLAVLKDAGAPHDKLPGSWLTYGKSQSEQRYSPLTQIDMGTGNAEPWVQKFRGAQDLDNLYTCSTLAVDLTTGQLKLYFQTVPNDNWDFDSVQHGCYLT